MVVASTATAWILLLYVKLKIEYAACDGPMDLEQWCHLDEQIYIAEMDERYKQHAGLSYSERIIEQLAEMRTISAKTFVDFFLNQESYF